MNDTKIQCINCDQDATVDYFPEGHEGSNENWSVVTKELDPTNIKGDAVCKDCSTARMISDVMKRATKRSKR